MLAQVLVAAFVLQVLVLPQLGGARDALDTVSGISPALIALAVALEIGAIVTYAQLTRALLTPTSRPSLGVASGVVLASLGVNHVVPGGAATTAAVNYRLFGLAGVPRPELALVLGLQAIGSAVVLNLLLWLALLISIPTTGLHPIYVTAAALGAIVMLLFGAGVLALLHGQDHLGRWARRASDRIPKLEPERVDQVLTELATQLRQLGADQRRLLTAIGLAAANWLLDAAALWVFLSAFGHTPHVVGLLVAYGLAYVIGAIPVTPGGLGVIEAVLIPTLVGFGTPASVAAVGVVAYRLVNFWLPIPTGFAAYVLVERSLSGRSDTPGVHPVLTELLEDPADPESRPDSDDGRSP